MTESSAFADPHVNWQEYLVAIAHNVDEKFQAEMKSLFGGKFKGAPVKRPTRARTKLRDDDPRLVYPGSQEMANDPDLCLAAGTLLDYVRGAIECTDQDEMLTHFKTICENFKVSPIRNKVC